MREGRTLQNGLSEKCRYCSVSLKAAVFRNVDVDLRKVLPRLH